MTKQIATTDNSIYDGQEIRALASEHLDNNPTHGVNITTVVKTGIITAECDTCNEAPEVLAQEWNVRIGNLDESTAGRHWRNTWNVGTVTAPGSTKHVAKIVHFKMWVSSDGIDAGYLREYWQLQVRGVVGAVHGWDAAADVTGYAVEIALNKSIERGEFDIPSAQNAAWF